jgi:Protein of unknown function (DUF3604)
VRAGLDPVGCVFEYNPNNDNAAGYVRDALAKGLMLERETGSNPLALGIIASTDTHNGAPGYVGEQNWNGHGGTGDDTAEERLTAPYFSPSSITAVWADENTRASIFAGLQNREAYATSGPRIRVRTYALALPDDTTAQTYCDDPRFPEKLVAAQAAPMGATISSTKRPYIFVSAMADQPPLASFDIIRIRATTFGARQLIHSENLEGAQRQSFCRFWSDPTFVADAPVLYYARVLEQTTPRWIARACEMMPDDPSCTDASIPKTIQERAWTSPIFATGAE